MLIKNTIVYTDDFEPHRTDILIENGVISRFGSIDGEGLDCSGMSVIPGFIDIHIHGCNGADATDGKAESVLKMSEYLAENGVTSFCPATMTLPVGEIKKSLGYIANAMGHEHGAYIHGVNLEGPFISPKKKGAQPLEYILSPDTDVFKELCGICPISLVAVAPELEGATEFAREVSKICTVSAAHTATTCKQAKCGFKNGFTHATHLFNAMTGLGSREAGVVGAVFDSESVTAELICDGIHVSPATLRIAFKLLSEDRACVISDATMAAGLPDGEYTLGGQPVVKRDAVRLHDGTLAGSSTNLFEEFHNLLRFGIEKKSALKAVSINPARAIGKEKTTGSIALGKSADMLIVSNDFSHIYNVIIKGTVFRRNNDGIPAH